MKARSKTIVARLHQQGAFLRKAHVKHANGRGGLTEFYIEPGSIRVRTKFAEEAIKSGWLKVRDNGLFGDDPQTWTVAR
jgi:hypothetical protein